MSDSGPSGEEQTDLDGLSAPWWSSRRLLVVVAVAVVALAAVFAALRLQADAPPAAGSSASRSPSASQSPSVLPDQKPAVSPTLEEPAQTGPSTPDPVTAAPYVPTAEPAVGLEDPGVFGTGVVARLVSIDAVDGVARGPGEASGPSLRLVIELVNDTAQPVSLNTTVVELYAGPEAIPSNLLSGGDAELFSGELVAGGTATASYVFRVDSALRDRVQVTISYTPNAPTVLFEGPAPDA